MSVIIGIFQWLEHMCPKSSYSAFCLHLILVIYYFFLQTKSSHNAIYRVPELKIRFGYPRQLSGTRLPEVPDPTLILTLSCSSDVINTCTLNNDCVKLEQKNACCCKKHVNTPSTNREKQILKTI